MGHVTDNLVWIGIGSNLGDRSETIRYAVRAMETLGVVEAASGLYETAPMYRSDQPEFLNAVVGLRTALGALSLLTALQHIERSAGRVREAGERNGPRTLDLDVLLYSEQSLRSPELAIPHPRILERGFVLVPLIEVAPDLRHPQTGQLFADALEALDTTDVVRVDDMSLPSVADHMESPR